MSGCDLFCLMGSTSNGTSLHSSLVAGEKKKKKDFTRMTHLSQNT